MNAPALDICHVWRVNEPQKHHCIYCGRYDPMQLVERCEVRAGIKRDKEKP